MSERASFELSSLALPSSSKCRYIARGILGCSFILIALLLPAATAPAGAQSTLERTSNLDGGWLGVPWSLDVELTTHFTTESLEGETVVLPTYQAAFSTPLPLLVGTRYAPNVLSPGGDRIWEIYARYADRPFPAFPGLDLAVTGWYSDGSEAVDAEVLLGHAFGPARLVGSFRSYTSLVPGERIQAVAGGALVHLAPGRLPIAIAVDAAYPFEEALDLPVVWSSGLQVGVPYTSVTLSLQASNALAPTLQGGIVALDDDVRWGFSFTAPVPVGRFLGRYPAREDVEENVIQDALPDPEAATVAIRNYAFGPVRVEIPAGGTVEWTNHDAVVHTVTADDGTFNSGGLQQDEVWRAQFMEPGVYVYHCGPHPYMTATIVVTDV